MATTRDHWEKVYANRPADRLSWHQPDPAMSVRLILGTGVGRDAPIIDVGGGSSRLAGSLLEAGFADVTVLDISGRALAVARRALADRAEAVTWIEADVTAHPLAARYAVWHDRAVLHFLTEDDDRRRYVAALEAAVVPGGYAVIATFGPDAPDRCSGLPVVRYRAGTLTEIIGPGFSAAGFETEEHRTPDGRIQDFLYGCFRRVLGPARS